MSTVGQQQLPIDVAHEDQVVRKVFNRVVPFLFVLMVIAYLDRVNMGFAALTMNKELRLTATMYGFANSLCLCRLFSLRNPEQPDASQSRSAQVDWAHHDHLGTGICGLHVCRRRT
jgi:hypothetical protein